MSEEEVLPPLPPSDQESLTHNRYDGNYRVRARDFWKEAGEVTSHKVEPFTGCDHYFITIPGGVKCKFCNFGMYGAVPLRNGKVVTPEEATEPEQ